MRAPRAVVEAALALVAGAALSVGMHWSVVRDLGKGIPGDLGDPLLQTWQLAWGGHGLLTQPLRVFETNAFAPLRNSLAFSDSLLGYAPLGIVGSGVDAAVTRYGLVFLLAHALAFAGTYLLARQVGAGRAGALVAGAAYAFSPFRLSQANHLNILSTGGIPLALAMLARGYGIGPGGRAPHRPGWIVAGWLTAAWQLSLGFGIGLQMAYLLAVLGLGALVVTAVRRDPPGRATLLATAVGVMAFLAAGVALAVPYEQVVRDHPESRRGLNEVQFYSPPLRSLLVAPPESVLWGERTAPLREDLTWRFEQSLLPGASVTVLALLGLLWGPLAWRKRAGLAGGVVLLVTLALGTFGPAGGRWGYLLLYEHAPGWQGVRTPSRLVTLAWLLLTLLAALGVQRLMRLLPRPGERAVLVAALLALVLVEGLGRIPTAVPRPVPEGLRLADLPQPVLVLPSEEYADNTVMLWSTDGFPAIANGASGFRPTQLSTLRAATETFPSPASVLALRAYGVRSVVLLVDQLSGTPLEAARSRGLPVGVGMTQDPAGAESTVIVYRLTP